MRDPENILAIAGLQPDYLGFVFYRPSVRYAGEMDPSAVHALPSDIRKTGVFVNASEQFVTDAIKRYRLDLVQLHGSESPELCRAVRRIVPVIKAVSVGSAEDIIRLTPIYRSVADYYLFDTRTRLTGGSGKQFDWSALTAYTGDLPFFLSGGIGLADAERIKNLSHPQLYAIDINSCFETAPGMKDTASVKNFLSSLKGAGKT
ncbi:MAG: phosphoribosylanthranilate isomerase [Bacteroidales bacterium]|nr:phosphoribosylanthranilate isomerase [Bacteroidales bacterium]